MKLQFKVVAKRGAETVAEILGRDDVAAAGLTVEDVTETEQFLERLTGLRFHIEQIQ